MITRADYDRLARGGYNRIPLHREVLADLETPVSAYLKMAQGPYSYLFESVQGGEKWGRYSIIGLPCSTVVRVKTDLLLIEQDGQEIHRQHTDDPLEAGLEIFASPPGKKLQVLSLLSGGEKALTALALLFAVFLTNPAPICVLDEVDAPLDDANVDRFCDLIEEIAHKSDTRFVVVTHHRLTMARVDRLFGVTMMERGVSQIVSVDLQRAERLREAS